MYPLTFTIDGLDLEPVMEINITAADNETYYNETYYNETYYNSSSSIFLIPYYIAVKAVTGRLNLFS